MSVDPPDSDREQLLQQAIAFLQSPQVSDAPQERKVAFLQQKGLTPLEIETLLQQVTPQSTEQTPQSSIEQKQQTSQPSTEQKQQTSTRKGESTNTVTQSNYMTAIKYGLGGYSLLMTLMIGIYSLYLKYYRPWIKLLRETRQKRAQERQVFFSKVNLWAKQFSQEGLASEIQKMIESTTKDLKEVKKAIAVYKPPDYSVTLQKTRDLTSEVSGMLYPVTTEQYTQLYGRNQSPELQVVKSEIRSLKGMLLSRRNFPTV